MKEHEVIKSIGDILDKYRAAKQELPADWPKEDGIRLSIDADGNPVNCLCYTEQEQPEWPQIGDDYLFVSSKSESGCFSYNGDRTDDFIFATRPVYKTGENVAIAERIWARAIELRGDWRADWGDPDKQKYLLVLFEDRVEALSDKRWRSQGTFYMPEHAAKTLLKEFTQEELRLWIEGEAV